MQKGHSIKRICRIWNKVNNVCCPSSRKDKKNAFVPTRDIFERFRSRNIWTVYKRRNSVHLFLSFFFHFPSTVHPRLHDVRREMIFNLNTGVVSVKNERQFCVKKFLLFHLTIHEPILATIYQLLKKFL